MGPLRCVPLNRGGGKGATGKDRGTRRVQLLPAGAEAAAKEISDLKGKLGMDLN